MKLTKTKEFSFMSKYKDKNKSTVNYTKTLMDFLRVKSNPKNNLKKAKNRMRNPKNTISVGWFYRRKNSQSQINPNTESCISEIKKEKNKKIKSIKAIRRILNEKSHESYLNIPNIDFQKVKNIKEILSHNKSINKERESSTVSINMNSNKMDKNESEKKKNVNLNSSTLDSINETFKKYLEGIEDEGNKLKNVLDPLTDLFKCGLREVHKFGARDSQNVWMKESTANLVSFGNSFQLMPDEAFYKDHRRIISKYPDLEKAADILVMAPKERDSSTIIARLESNKRKIRNIMKNNEDLIKKIKTKYFRPSNSMPFLRKKNKK